MKSASLRVTSDREWLLTNGLGGYSLGFGNMMHKRKYNGLLIAADSNQKRFHLVSSIEEKVERGSGFFYLDSNHYTNCIYPEGYRHILKSWLRPYPGALYSSLPANDETIIFKEIFLCKGLNAVVVKYTNLGRSHISIVARPKLTMRDHHIVNKAGVWDRISTNMEFGESLFRVRREDNGIETFGYVKGGNILEEPTIYRSVYYPVEAIRGYDSVEDLFSPARIVLDIVPGSSSTIVFSDKDIPDVWSKAAEAEAYYKSLPLPADHPEVTAIVESSELAEETLHSFDFNSYSKMLGLMCEDFVLDGDDIIAGYPWFGAWGRDTMISLSGLKYLEGGKNKALSILKKYGRKIKIGLLPNTFGEGGEGLNYDSVDAPLWYVVRSYEFAKDDKELFKNCQNIVLNYMYADELPFHLSDDGLIEIKRGDWALTWMDAKVYGTPVTPRYGKPVEINALWFNALCAVREMAKGLGIKKLSAGGRKCPLSQIDELIDKISNSFEEFVGEDYLADRIEDGRPIWEIRPNAVIALSLPFDLVGRDVMERVWKKAKAKLLTPYGLRSLDPTHPAFKQKYVGNGKQRDLAYHQGTVWTFPLLPFAELTTKIYGGVWSNDDIHKEISRYVWVFRDAFFKGEMASVAEIWDGLDPYFPKGCPAQAWSAFAIMEIEQILAGLKGDKG